MFLREPAPTRFDLNFRIGDVPVRVHPLFWLIALLIGEQGLPPTLILIWIAVVFFSILVHELGHVLAFRYYGVGAHVVLYAMGGLAVPGGGFSPWGQTSRADRGWSRVVISLAGPAAGFLLAAFVISVLYAANRSIDFGLFGWRTFRLGMGPPLLSPEVSFPLELYYTVHSLLFVNIFWGLVNLLPIYPLDGGQAARELFLMYDRGQGVHHSLILSLVVSLGVAAWAANERDWFIAIFFAFFAYQSYQMMQMNRGGPGGGYTRPW